MKAVLRFDVICVISCAIAPVAFWFLHSPESVPVPVKKLSMSRNATPAPAEVRETFAPRMPSGQGVALITSNGDYNANHLMVAVPNQSNKIQYLPGTDPRAVQYLREKRITQEQMIVDNGPSRADLSAVPVKQFTSRQAKRIMVDAPAK